MNVIGDLVRIIVTVVMGALCGVGACALDGSWRGNLELGQMKMPIVFNFSQSEDGAVTMSIDSPNQGVKGIPAEVLYCSVDSISVQCASIGGAFTGKISDNRIDGVFSQRGYNIPLKLTPELSVEERRPQTPKPPFAYEAVDTVFYAKNGVKLAGTLVVPYTANSAKMPVVVMVSGSGPQNRDEEIFEHRPFAVIADKLAAKGIASFRYDDRGVGDSEGDFAASDTYDFADDARSAVEFVKQFPQFGKVGVLGHSEGGMIAFMLGATNDVDFIVSMAGVGVSGKEIMLAQNRHSLVNSGVSGDDLDNWMNILSLMFDEVRRLYGDGKIEGVDIDRLIADNNLTVAPMVRNYLKSSIKSGTNRQIYCLASLEPEKWLTKINVPLLALNGDKDTQVDAEANLSAIKQWMPTAKVKSYPDLNHMFQHCASGEVSEYGEISETISEEVVGDIIDFIISLRRHE